MPKNIVPIWLLAPLLLSAFARAADWTTFGGDPQRTGWAKDETDLTKDSIKKLKLEWSLKLDSPPKELTGLTAPLARATMATPRGVKDLVVVAGPRDQVFVIDADTGKVFDRLIDRWHLDDIAPRAKALNSRAVGRRLPGQDENFMSRFVQSHLWAERQIPITQF